MCLRRSFFLATAVRFRIPGDDSLDPNVGTVPLDGACATSSATVVRTKAVKESSSHLPDEQTNAVERNGETCHHGEHLLAELIHKRNASNPTNTAVAAKRYRRHCAASSWCCMRQAIPRARLDTAAYSNGAVGCRTIDRKRVVEQRVSAQARAAAESFLGSHGLGEIENHRAILLYLNDGGVLSACFASGFQTSACHLAQPPCTGRATRPIARS